MTAEQKNQILENAYIPQEWWENCFITEDEMIFTPLFNEEGLVTKTGEQVHAEWLANKENPPVPEPTEIEVLQQENKMLKAQVEALSATSDFHEELIAEMAMKVYA